MTNQRPLNQDDKKAAVIVATNKFDNAKKRWLERQQTGLNDEDLIKALQYEIGIAGASSATENGPSIHCQGSGLKIWASWRSFNYYNAEPIFQGAGHSAGNSTSNWYLTMGLDNIMIFIN